MFDGADTRARIVANNSAESEVLHEADICRYLGNDSTALAYNKTETRIRFSRVEHQRYRCSTVHPRALQLDLARDRRLSRADKSL